MTSIPHIPILRGRAATPVRPGLVIKGVLSGQIPLATGEIVYEAAIVDLHNAYKELINQENDLRPQAKRLKGMTYPSFLKLFKFAQLLHLVTFVREEPLEYTQNLLSISMIKGKAKVVASHKRVFKLSDVGAQDEKSWTNLCKAWMEGWLAPQAAEYAQPVYKHEAKVEEIITEEPEVVKTSTAPKRGRPKKAQAIIKEQLEGIEETEEADELEEAPEIPEPKHESLRFTPYKWRSSFSMQNIQYLIQHLKTLNTLGVNARGVKDELSALSGKTSSWISEAEDSLAEVKAIGYQREAARFSNIINRLTAVKGALARMDIQSAITELSGFTMSS